MIGKIVKGTSFSGCVNYVLKEDKSRLLKAVGVYGSPEEIKINDCEGIYIPENDSEGLVAWVMDGYLFTLNGNIDKMSLLNLAKATNVEK